MQPKTTKVTGRPPCPCWPKWLLDKAPFLNNDHPPCIVCNHVFGPGEIRLRTCSLLRCAHQAKIDRIHQFQFLLCAQRPECTLELNQLIESDPISKTDMQRQVVLSDGALEKYRKNHTLTGITCSGCHRFEITGRKFLVCAQCHKVAYCSRACQVSDWKKNHKAICCPRQETKNSTEEEAKQHEHKFDLCECMNVFERYAVEAANHGHCSRLGCKSPNKGPTWLSMQLVSCQKGVHVCPLNYCCVQCDRRQNVGRAESRGIQNPQPWKIIE